MAKKMKKPKKIVKPAKKRPAMSSHNGYGILSPYGDMWTSSIFNSPTEAKDYIRDFWRGVKGHDITKYRIVWAKQSVRYLREAAGGGTVQ